MSSAFGNAWNSCYLGQTSVLKKKQPRRPSKLGCAELCLLRFGGSPALHWGCGLCRELGCLAQPPHPLPDCSRSDPGIHCPPRGACREAAIFTSSLSLPLGPGPRTGWHSFGNTPWFHASLLEVTVERQKNKWAIRAKPLSSQNISLCIRRASGAFVWASAWINWMNSSHLMNARDASPWHISSPLQVQIIISRKQDLDPWSCPMKPYLPSLLQSPWLLLCVTGSLKLEAAVSFGW